MATKRKIRPWRAALVAGVGALGLIAAETPGASAVTGTISEFPVTTAFSGPDKITAGPDGNLWFTEMVANKIGRVTTAGVVTEFPVTTASSGPIGITAGPDGNLWFTEMVAGKVGRITTAGVVTEFPVTTESS
ncbi:MAG: virginiamycin lyase [Solirubrobacteraceae bacterium]|jgi:virginiamycin B lyase|nr:virginiamycin lyase [Solirubrobacteraceae bacterium]